MVLKGCLVFILAFVFLVNGAFALTSISTCQDLQDMNLDLNENYVLSGDIDCSSYSGFVPIADFGGSLDGQFFTIEGLNIDLPSQNFVGLFGNTLPSSEISNLLIVGASIQGKDSVGILVGSSQGDIRNVAVEGGVLGFQNVGGLAGANRALIFRSKADVVVNAAIVNSLGSDGTGGLVGLNGLGGTILDSYSIGSVLSSVESPSPQITVGGLVGLNSPDASVENSYSIATASNPFDSPSGVVGISQTGASCSGNYWDNQATGLLGSPCATGQSTAQMQLQSTFSGWDFTFSWALPLGNYPCLRWEPSCQTETAFWASDSLGSFPISSLQINESTTVYMVIDFPGLPSVNSWNIEVFESDPSDFESVYLTSSSVSSGTRIIAPFVIDQSLIDVAADELFEQSPFNFYISGNEDVAPVSSYDVPPSAESAILSVEWDTGSGGFTNNPGTGFGCINPSPEICNNLVDDDCDGQTDAADSDCDLTPPTIGINSCEDYLNQTTCDQNLQNFGPIGLPPGYTCLSVGGANESCGCEWVDFNGTQECRSFYRVISDDESPVGTCHLTEDSSDTCEGDNLLTVSWTGTWTWHPDNDDMNDPNDASIECSSQHFSDPVPCTGQVQLPLTNKFSFVLTLLVLLVIYAIFLKGGKKDLHEEKNS